MLADQRRLRRTSLRIPCRVYGDDAVCRHASIHTVNLNRKGLLMSWENAAAAPQIGAHLEIEVPLPGHPVFGSKCMYFEAVVRRVEFQDGCRYLVAVEASKSGFRQLQAPELPPATLLVQ